MEKSVNESRRDFLKKSAGTLTLTGLLAPPIIVPASALGRGATPPSDRVTVGIIGSGQRAVFETASVSLFRQRRHRRRVSDVVESHRQERQERPRKTVRVEAAGAPQPKSRTYSDFQ